MITTIVIALFIILLILSNRIENNRYNTKLQNDKEYYLSKIESNEYNESRYRDMDKYINRDK